jgi:ankyrin repeat protein
MGRTAVKATVWRWTGLLALMVSVAMSAADVRLVDAAKARDSATVRALLKQKLDVNTPQPDGATALHWAAHWDDAEIADLLIAARANVNAANDFGVTPLSLACTNGSRAMVDRLLKAGATPRTALPSGETPLMTCARSGNAETVRLLLARGADANTKENTSGQTALMWAAAEGHTNVVRMLIENRAEFRARSTEGFTPLLFAARKGSLETVRVLLRAGADVDEAAPDGTTALVIATIRANQPLAEMLLNEGANANAGPGFTPLHWMAGNYLTELSDNNSGILAEESEWSFLGGLWGTRRLEFVRMLLAHGADVNARAEANINPYVGGNRRRRGGNLAGATPFLWAAETNDVDLMRTLLAAGASPNVATSIGTTPLMVAAGVGFTQGRQKTSVNTALPAVKFLVEELAADVNTVNAAGETALHGAAYRQDGAPLVQYLVDKGANMNVKSKRGWTPLVIAEGVLTSAFVIRAPETMELLRKLGAEPSPPDVIRDQPTIDRLLQEKAKTP